MSECKSASAASKGSELARDSHQRVVWMNDALPDLRALRALGRRFDLILLSAVWMHVAPKGRERAFRILSELLGPSGLLAITLRLGGDGAENAARGFHDTSAEELIGHANRRAIALRSRTTQPDLRRPSLTWETLVFAMPDDGTGSLPLLRHVIVNDNKSSTYKLGLLRTLVRLAETAPGLVIERTDDYVDIPFGAVGLYWLKQYLPLVLHHCPRIRSATQRPWTSARQKLPQLLEFVAILHGGEDAAGIQAPCIVGFRVRDGFEQQVFMARQRALHPHPQVGKYD